MSIAATLLLLALQDDHLQIDEVSESFTRQWAEDEDTKSYKELFDRYDIARLGTKGRLAAPDPAIDRWIPVGRVLAAKLMALPASALEAHEVIARQVLDTSLEPGERRKAIEKYLYTQVGRDALDLQANVDCDQGRLSDALRGWSRAFELRPSAEVAARMALVHASRNDGVALATLRVLAETKGLKGQVLVGGRSRELYEYIDSLGPSQRPEVPGAPEPAAAPTCQIPLGHFEFDVNTDGRYGDYLAVSLPAAGVANGKDLVVVSNGFRVTAVAPGRAEGGTLEDTVEWRFPKNAPTRLYTLLGQNPTLPYVGATVSGELAFCPMFPERLEAKQQRGRRSQTFLGPSSLVALELATGRVVWDTDSVLVESEGLRRPLQEYLHLENTDFCFGGPPVVRGRRVYAPIMTSPNTGRSCWVLCLDAQTGQPVWFTYVGSAPQTRDMSVALLAEEEGSVVMSTNFGVVAALDSATGAFDWLVKYKGSNRPWRAIRGGASPPVIAGGLVYVLPQDYDELLAFDRWTGLEAALPKPKRAIPWGEIVHFLGRADEWLVFSGPKNVALRPLDGEVVLLPDSEAGKLGRGTISGGRLYLPTVRDVSIFETRTWKPVETLRWPEASSGAANALVAGPLLISMSNRLDLYTSFDLLRARFGVKDGGGPTRPQENRQLARILEGAGLLKDSVPYYRRALRTWEKDPDWQETAEGLRKKLADLAEKLGGDFPPE